MEFDAEGRWSVDGEVVDELDGCLDLDLEASACTNAIHVHRLQLDVGDSADVPAACVRVRLDVERLEQRYVRIEDEADRQRYDYSVPAFDFTGRLVYDEFGGRMTELFASLCFPVADRLMPMQPEPEMGASPSRAHIAAFVDNGVVGGYEPGGEGLAADELKSSR